MIKQQIAAVEKAQLRTDLPEIRIGDTVEVHTKWTQLDAEGKPVERIAIFTGIVIARKGRGTGQTITVRKGAKPEGIEKVFPLHSPSLVKIVLKSRPSRVRRAKLYYLRGRLGKRAKKI